MVPPEERTDDRIFVLVKSCMSFISSALIHFASILKQVDFNQDYSAE